MCSIGGAVFKDGLRPDEAHRLANALLFFGRERGDQSAGLWLEGMGGPPFKRAVDVSTLINSKAYANVFDCVRPGKRLVMLTHTRFPTCGGREDKDAQPFKAGDTVTVHNGVIVNPSQLDKKFSLKRRTGVDSEVFTRYINRYGVRNLPKFLKSLSGSMAVVAYKSGKQYAFRDGNPLWVAVLKDEGIIWASTKAQINAAMIAMWGYHCEHDLVELKENAIYAFRDRGVVERLATFQSKPYSIYYDNNQYGISVYRPSLGVHDIPERSYGGAHKIVRMGSDDPETPWSIWAKEGELSEETLSIEKEVDREELTDFENYPGS